MNLGKHECYMCFVSTKQSLHNQWKKQTKEAKQRTFPSTILNLKNTLLKPWIRQQFRHRRSLTSITNQHLFDLVHKTQERGAYNMNGLVRDIHTVSFLNQNVLCQACRIRIERIEPEEHMEQENPCSPHIILCRNKMIFEHLRSNISLFMIENKVTNTLLPVTDLHRTEELSVMQDEQMERPKSANIAYGVTTILE